MDFIEYAPRHTYPYTSSYGFANPTEATPNPQFHYVHSDRDVLTLPIRKHKNMNLPLRVESPEEEISLRKYIGGGVSLVSLITENLLSHPFVVLRRQCQVHHNSTKYMLHDVIKHW